MNNKTQEITARIELLVSSINESNVIDTKKELFESINELHLQCMEKENFFSTYINSFIRDLSNFIYESKSPFIQRILDDSRIKLLNEYKLYLKELSEYKKYEKECFEAAKKTKSSLLQTNILSIFIDNYPIGYIPTIIDSLAVLKKEELKTKFKTLQDKEKQKQLLLFFYDDLLKHISTLKHNLKELKNELETSTKELKNIPDGFEEYTLPDGEPIEVSYFDSYHSEVKQIIDEIEITGYHLNKLINLEKELYQSYIFLKEIRPKRLSKETVFNKIKPEQLDYFIDSFTDFTGPELSKNRLRDIFLIEHIPKSKINLINGTLADFGSLIHKLKPYFIQELSNPKNYNSWWADRFTFNNAVKNKKTISNMISAFRKGDRIPTKTDEITIIIQHLDDVLH